MKTIGYLILAAAVASVSAQSRTLAAGGSGLSSGGSAVSTISQPTLLYGGGVASPYLYGGYSGTTVAGSYLRGLADVIRSTGERNLANSAAAINWSTARQHEIENYHLWVTTYFDARNINREYREAANRRERGNPANFVRYAHLEAPKPLNNSQLDAVTGQIRWPILLTSADFSQQRAILEKIFSTRAYRGVLGADDYLAAVRTIGDMTVELTNFVTSVPPQSYTEAKGFLRSLAYEARLPAG